MPPSSPLPCVLTCSTQVATLNALLLALCPAEAQVRSTRGPWHERVSQRDWDQATCALRALDTAPGAHLQRTMGPSQALHTLMALDLPSSGVTFPGGGTTVWIDHFAEQDGQHLWYRHAPQQDLCRAVLEFRATFAALGDGPAWAQFGRSLRSVRGRLPMSGEQTGHSVFEHHPST